MTKKQRFFNILAIYTVAFLQMGGAGLSPVMAKLGEAFPNAGAGAIQLVMTIPSLFVVLTNLVTGWLMAKFPKKYITAVGCGLAVLFAVLGCFVNSSLTILYVWAAVLGIGTSLSCTVSPQILNEMFEPEERMALQGTRTAASSVGTMLMTFIGGFLVAKNWKYGFLVYLVMVPGLLLSLFAHPKETRLASDVNTAEAQEKPMQVKALIFPCIAGLAASFIYSCAMTNNSMLVAELGTKGLLGGADPSVLGGYLTTIILVVGFVIGLLVAPISKKIGLQCISLGFVLLTAGYVVIFFAQSFWMLVVAAILMGGALNCVMPHVTILGSEAGGSKAGLSLSIALGAANLGTLISAVIPSLTAAIFHTEEVRYRYLFSAILALVVAVCFIVYLARKPKAQKAA